MSEKDFMGQPISPDAPASSAADRVSDVPPGRPPNWPLQSFDAREWGAEFCRIGRARGLDLDDEDESWIVGWFANALMKGWDEQRRRTDAEAARPRVETTPAGATVDTNNPTSAHPPEVVRLIEAARLIAAQKTTAELSSDESPDADFEGAYDAIIECLRAALTPFSETGS